MLKGLQIILRPVVLATGTITRQGGPGDGSG